MKKIVLTLTSLTILLLSACSDKKEETKREMVFLNDSLYRSNLNSDTAAITKNDPVVAENNPAPYRRPAQRTRRFENDNNTPAENQQTIPPPVVIPPAPLPVPAPASSTNTPSTTNEKDDGTIADIGNTETKEADAEKAIPKKEGISKAVKGAVIGGVGGAVVGAVISKKGKGAVIGGILGAAGGYVLGRKKDKADGRGSNLARL